GRAGRAGAGHDHARGRVRDRGRAARWLRSSWGSSLEPMLKNLDIDGVSGGPAIVGPDLALPEAHAVERLARRARPVVGEFLGIAVGAAEPLDHAGAAADVPGRADVAGRVGEAHAHAIAGPEARRGRLRRAHDDPARAFTASILRPSSSVPITPRSSSTLVIAAIQRS